MKWLYSSLDVVPTRVTGGGSIYTHTQLTSDTNERSNSTFILDYEYISHTNLDH